MQPYKVRVERTCTQVGEIEVNALSVEQAETFGLIALDSDSERIDWYVPKTNKRERGKVVYVRLDESGIHYE